MKWVLILVIALTSACSSDSSKSGTGGTAAAGGVSGTGGAAAAGGAGGTGGAAAAGGAGGTLEPPFTGPPGAWQDPTPSPLPGTWPSGFSYVALAFDSTRDKMLFFPHDIATSDFEVWDWDGPTATFTQRTPAALPADWPLSQSGYGAAYDPLRGVVVFYGRVTGPPDLVTLEWEPASGELRDVSPANPQWYWPRGGSFLFFHEALGSVVQYATDLLLRWDPSARTWVDSTPLTFPSGFQGLGQFAHDTTRGKLYGFDLYVNPVRIAELDLATGIWTPRNPATFPSDWPTPVHVASATYAASLDRVVITGAAGATEPGTYEWDPATGNMTKYPVADPDQMPVGAHSAYDAATGMVTAVTASYDNDGYLGDVFTWQDSVWTRHRGNHVVQTWPRPEPMVAGSMAATYDPHRQRTLLFLNTRADEAMGTLLEWDGSTWTDRTPADPNAAPSARYHACLGYDMRRQRVVLYGGRAQAERLHDVWEWDPEAGSWANRTPTPLPDEWPAVIGGSSLAYDAVSGGMMLVSQGAESTWIWHGDSGIWTRQVPQGVGGTPLGVSFSGIVHDERLKRPLLLGKGFSDDATAWTFDRVDTQWVELTPSGAALTGPDYMKVAYDRVRGSALAIGTISGTQLISFDPARGVWADESPVTPPASWPDENVIVSVGAMAYDVARETLVVVFHDGRVAERPSR